ncbi:glycoside hydrolase family 38 C-terminal domain-containing protein [Bacillus sp. Marseille-Q3570]|uniref:glycoside hydrolase family 38 N-terminal domain-containing protein n=1 Tax=Bacillus sp. Marseille-Q3570 TaxID=2963522 RepID=UPI0021B78B81|nr:glycoside hydrolase family 38 C-terminal domain-containing protein [Bacillus sp. Marseille-Q3570]
MKQKRVYVVPHSHWDREWYFTIEDSNLLLVENLDALMTVLENDEDFTGYVFDAQSSLVEEYLKVRPEDHDRLKNHIKSKRIFVGPWYTQTDSLLVNKESIIRNLLYGTRIAEQMGHSMEVGYLPDIFGQNAYLPSIFKGFGMEYSILQRGIYNDEINGDLNFVWKSPDGETVKTNYMYLGYGPGKFLSAEGEFYEEKLGPMLEKLTELNNSTDNLLLPSGGDQVFVRSHFPETIKKLNEKDEKHEYVLSDYETFMEETWSEETFSNVIEGELLASQKSRIHNTIRSQRYDIKQLNEIVENKILYVLEPLAVIGQTLGLKYPQNWLDQMWKELFDVHAHDSIGGCNSDDTNHDIVVRLEKVDRMTEGLINIIKKQLTEAISKKAGRDDLLVTFNTKPYVHKGVMEAVIFTDSPDFAVEKLDGEAVDFEVTDQTYMSGGKKVVVTAEGDKEVEIPGYYRSEIHLVADGVPAMGYATFVTEDGAEKVNRVAEIDSSTISNDNLQVTFEDGKLNLTNFESGETIEQLLTFENVADAGDSYDFSPLKGDQEIIIKEAELVSVEHGNRVQTMTVKHKASVPGTLEEREAKKNTKTLEILTCLELRVGEAFLRVEHEIDNDICDHRVRVKVNTPFTNVQHSYADQAFSVLKRSTENPYFENWREEGFVEAPVPIYPLENFAAVSDHEQTLALVTKGLKEYEVLPETGEIALTLFRSVGLLGRDNLLWRPGRASGINNKVVKTPDAQLQQKLTFEYSINFTNEAMNPVRLFQATEKFKKHEATYQKQTLNTFEERLERFEIPYPIDQLDDQFSLFKIENDQVFVSTVKQAHDKDGMIVRLFNPTEEVQKASIETDQFAKQVLVNLHETEATTIEGSFEVPAKGYTTVKLKAE